MQLPHSNTTALTRIRLPLTRISCPLLEYNCPSLESTAPQSNQLPLSRVNCPSLESTAPQSSQLPLTRISCPLLKYNCPSLESAAPYSNISFILQEILAQFEPLKNVVFKPIQLEPQRAAQPLLPLSFSITSHPFNYFTLFFTYNLLQLITKHTNDYTAIKRLQEKDSEYKRIWFNLVVEELYIFIGSIIYIGIYKEPDISIY